MSGHAVYSRIVYEIKNRTLKEPFTAADFQNACPGFGRGTYKAFLYKHCVGNVRGDSELFERVSQGNFRLARPFKYSLD
jgi:hypothetical protein